MPDDFALFLGLTPDNKWHIIAPNGVVLRQYDSQEEAIKGVNEIMGHETWDHAMLQDDVGDGVAEAVMEKREKAIN